MQAAPKTPSKTHCTNGHPLSGDNLEITFNGGSYCRTCHRDAILEAKKRARLKRKPNQEVAPGQIWRERNQRHRGRHIRIVAIIGDSAIVKPLRRPKRPVAADWFLVDLKRFLPHAKGLQTRARVSCAKLWLPSTGY